MEADDSEPPPELAPYLGEDVVLDTAGPLVYVGRLVRLGQAFFVLADADVHDVSRSTTTKERYVLEARKHGIRKNRDEVLVRQAEVTSLSRLRDVTDY